MGVSARMYTEDSPRETGDGVLDPTPAFKAACALVYISVTSLKETL